MYQNPIRGWNRAEIGCPIPRCQRVFDDFDVSAMYQFGEHRAVSACAALYRPVHPSPQLDHYIPTDSGTDQHPDTSAFPLWEQEAGSSNLPTPTSGAGRGVVSACSDWVGVSAMYQITARVRPALNVGLFDQRGIPVLFGAARCSGDFERGLHAGVPVPRDVAADPDLVGRVEAEDHFAGSAGVERDRGDVTMM